MRPLLLLLACLSVAPLPAAAQAFILVRHAEKADTSDDTELSAEGRVRAQRLAEMLAEAGVTHVFATQYRRTQQTVAPTAQARGLEIETVAADTATLVERLKALPPDAVPHPAARGHVAWPVAGCLSSSQVRRHDSARLPYPRSGARGLRPERAKRASS